MKKITLHKYNQTLGPRFGEFMGKSKNKLFLEGYYGKIVGNYQ